MKTDQVKGRVSKINQVKEYVTKNDQLRFLHIAVDRLCSFDRFLKHAFNPDRLFIGGIDANRS